MMDETLRRLYEEADRAEAEVQRICRNNENIFADHAYRERGMSRDVGTPTRETTEAQTMSAARTKDWKDWDDWFAGSFANFAATERGWADHRIQAYCEKVMDIVGEETAKRENILRAEIAKLRDEIGSLRADLTILQGIVRGEIAQLKGNTDVAA